MVFRLLPVHMCQVAQVEAYFANMAERGYFVKYVLGFVCLQRGKKEKTKYHLEPVGDMEKKPLDKLRLEFEEAGWEYICKLSNVFYIFKSVGVETREVPHNPLLQEKEIKRIRNICLQRFIGMLFASLLSLFFMIYLSFLQDHFIYHFVSSGFFILPLAFLYAGYEAVREYQSIKTVKQYLEKGYISHQELSFSPKKWKVHLHYFMTFTVILGISTFYCQKFTAWEENLVDYQGKNPAMSLSTIETNPSLQIENSLTEKELLRNTICFEWSGLAPEMYEIWESGEVKDRENGSGYTVGLGTEVYNLRFQFLVDPFLEDLLGYKMDLHSYRGMEWSTLEGTKFDQAYYAQGNNLQDFCASTGKKVIYVYYGGHKDLSEFADEMYQALMELE